jgi:site-specific DNA recombinase
MMAELFVYLGSFFAQLELNRFKTRALDGHRVLRQTDRWASGVPPLGFKVVDHPSGKGKGLATDSGGKKLLKGMADKLLDGWSFVRIAAWLNDEAHLTNMDRARVAKGQEPKARPWTVSTVIDALTSPRTQGLKMHKGRTVLDGDGEPIRLAAPTFDPDTWRQIQDAATLRQINQRTPTVSANPMLRVGFCGVCGASLAQQVTRRKQKDGTVKVHRYYRCGRTPLNCNGVTIKADDGDRQRLPRGSGPSGRARPRRPRPVSGPRPCALGAGAVRLAAGSPIMAPWHGSGSAPSRQRAAAYWAAASALSGLGSGRGDSLIGMVVNLREFRAPHR